MPAIVPANGRFSLTVRLGGVLLQGPPGPPGVGVPPGGTTGQTLTKLSDSDYDTGWRTPTGGGGASIVVDSTLSLTSTNPVENKVIAAALAGKASTATATQSASGLMSAADKTKLDSLPGAGVTVDTEMSSTSANPVQNKVVKSYVDTKVSGLQTASQVQDAIKSAISGVYTPKGSIAFASLPTAAAENNGWVYNVTDAFTTTEAFVEGAGHSYGAGTNVVCVDAGSGSYKWDVLAGIIDLTELTADEVQTLWDSI